MLQLVANMSQRDIDAYPDPALREQLTILKQQLDSARGAVPAGAPADPRAGAPVDPRRRQNS